MKEEKNSMKWIHVKAAFTGDDLQLSEELVTDIFLNLGLKGVVCEVPLPPPAEGFGSDALPPPSQNAISGYLPDTPDSREMLTAIKQRAGETSGLRHYGDRHHGTGGSGGLGRVVEGIFLCHSHHRQNHHQTHLAGISSRQ